MRERISTNYEQMIRALPCTGCAGSGTHLQHWQLGNFLVLLREVIWLNFVNDMGFFYKIYLNDVWKLQVQ
jgi:hypothetical protein